MEKTKYKFEQLTKENIQNYSTILDLSKTDYIEKSFIGIGIGSANEKLGALVGKLHPENASVFLNSIHIQPRYQRNGLGSELLKFTEHKLKEAGYGRIIFEFMVNENETSAGEAFLLNHGWSEPEERIFQYIVELSNESRNILNNSTIPEGFSFFPWGELGKDDRNQISSGKGKWYPEILSPFHDEDKIDVNLSMGLRFHDEVVGWLIIQRITRNMILAKTLFIKENILPVRRGLPLLFEGYNRVLSNNEIKYATGFVEKENVIMLRLIEKYFKKDVIRRKKLVRMTKTL